MTELKIHSRKSDTTVSINYAFPTSVAHAVEMFGEDVVLNRFSRQLSQELRAVVIRNVEAAVAAKENPDKEATKGLEKNPQKAATQAAGEFKPSVTSGTTRAARTIDKALAGLSDEERVIVLSALSGAKPGGNSGSASGASSGVRASGDSLASE